jgi:hypothetical protein
MDATIENQGCGPHSQQNTRTALAFDKCYSTRNC